MSKTMDSSPKCSVVIPTYNREQLLRHTLDSLTRQTLPTAEFEVLVVDDGSNDKTRQLVESYEGRLRLRYFFQEDEGWRVARARNVGIMNATADICVFIDSGVLLQSGCLAAHLESHNAVDRPVMVCGYVYGFNIDNEDGELLEHTIDLSDLDATFRNLSGMEQWLDIREEFYAKYTDDFNHLPAPWVVFWTCNASARTEQLRSVGAFDENFRCWGGEDIDLGYRLYLDRADVLLARQAIALHFPHQKSFEGTLAGATENYHYMARKYGTPVSQLLPLLGTEVNPFNINDVIRERGLVNCRDHMRLAYSGASRPAGG